MISFYHASLVVTKKCAWLLKFFGVEYVLKNLYKTIKGLNPFIGIQK